MSKSGVRTKFLIESLRNEYYELRKENEKLRAMVSDNDEVFFSSQNTIDKGITLEFILCDEICSKTSNYECIL